LTFAHTEIVAEDINDRKDDPPSSFDEFAAQLDEEISSYYGQELPSALKPFVSDEILFIEIVRDSRDTLDFLIVVEEGVIVSPGEISYTEAGYTVSVTQAFIEENQDQAFGRIIREGIATGDIEYTAEGFWRKVKLSMMLAAVDVATLFE